MIGINFKKPKFPKEILQNELKEEEINIETKKEKEINIETKKEKEINTETNKEINSKINLNKKFENIKNDNKDLITPEKKDKKKEKLMDIEISDEEDIKINTEKELEKIILKDDIVVRLIEKNSEKYIDFSKFYKGYPTKKSFKINYNIYKQINNYLNNKYK